MSAERWARVRESLAAAGVEGRLDEHRYRELEYGRPVHGTTRSIWIARPNGGVAIADRWWSKNTNVWIGYEVTVEDAEGIIVRSFPTTKKRAEVVAAVTAALAGKEVAR